MSTLEQDVLEILELLGAPVTAAEAQQGWDAERKSKWHDWFSDLHRKLRSGDRPEYISAARGMDFDGVGDSSIATLAARISNRVNSGEGYRQT